MGAVVWARRISSVVVCIAAVVLLGWIFQIEQLTAFVPGRSSTRPESALAFLFAAAGVWGLTSDVDRYRNFGWAAALACGALGVSALCINAWLTTSSLETIFEGRPF